MTARIYTKSHGQNADTSSSLTVEFQLQNLQSLDDESWALDNVGVYLYSSDVVNDVIWSTGDTTLSDTVSPSTTTTYYATLDDGLSLCLDSAVVTLSNQPPVDTCLTDITTASSTDGTGGVRLRWLSVIQVCLMIAMCRY